MSLLNRRAVILAKTEVTYGVDPTPSGAANAILVSAPKLSPLSLDTAKRDLVRPYLGASEEMPTAAHRELEFEVELAGAGAAGTVPKYGPLLRACGMSETISAGVNVVYAPVSTGFESVTLYFHVDGKLFKLKGARGSWTLDLSAKQIPKLKFKFSGLYSAVADAAVPSADFTGFQRPLPVITANTTTVSVHGVSPVLSKFSVDWGAQVKYRSPVGAEAVLITDRAASGSITVEDVLVATKDWDSICRNATLGALQIVHGTAAGHKVQIDAASVMLGKPDHPDEDGVRMLSMSLTPLPVSGNDDLTLTIL